VIIFGLLAISAYAAVKGIETRARIGQIIVWLIFIPLIFVLVLVSIDVDFSNILPAGEAAPMDMAKGGFYCLSAFSGLELMLLISPYLNRHDKIKGRVGLAVGLSGALLCAITLITISRFGAVNILNIKWPVLEMTDAIDLPATFIERQEVIIMSLWMLSAFAGVNAGLFFGQTLAAEIFKKGREIYYLAGVVIFSFIVCFFIEDVGAVYKIMYFNFLYLGSAYMLIIPLLLNLAAKIRGYEYGGK